MSAIQMASTFKWDMKSLFSRESGIQMPVIQIPPAVVKWKSYLFYSLTPTSGWMILWTTISSIFIGKVKIIWQNYFRSFPIYNFFGTLNPQCTTFLSTLIFFNIHKCCIWEFVIKHWLNMSNRSICERSYIKVFYIEGWLYVDFSNWTVFSCMTAKRCDLRLFISDRFVIENILLRNYKTVGSKSIWTSWHSRSQCPRRQDACRSWRPNRLDVSSCSRESRWSSTGRRWCTWTPEKKVKFWNGDHQIL